MTTIWTRYGHDMDKNLEKIGKKLIQRYKVEILSQIRAYVKTWVPVQIHLWFFDATNYGDKTGHPKGFRENKNFDSFLPFLISEILADAQILASVFIIFCFTPFPSHRAVPIHQITHLWNHGFQMLGD